MMDRCWLVALCSSDFSEPQAGSWGGRRATAPVRGVVHFDRNSAPPLSPTTVGWASPSLTSLPQGEGHSKVRQGPVSSKEGVLHGARAGACRFCRGDFKRQIEQGYSAGLLGDCRTSRGHTERWQCRLHGAECACNLELAAECGQQCSWEWKQVGAVCTWGKKFK